MLKRLLRDRRGTTTVEMAVIVLLMMVVTFGVIDFGYAFWQWNSSEKAVQRGAREAVVSDLVAEELADFDCGAGTSLIAGTFCSDPAAVSFGTVTCSGATSSCSGDYTFSTAAFNRVLAAAQAVYPPVTAANLVIEYRDVGLGFVRRGAPVPAVTVRLVDMDFDLIILGNLLGLNPTQMPIVLATLVAEDADSNAPS